VAEKIDVEMGSYRQLSEVQMFRDLDFDLGWGQGTLTYTVRVGLAVCLTM